MIGSGVGASASVALLTEFSALCQLMLEEDAEVAFTFGYPARPWIKKMFKKILAHPLMSIGADSILPKKGTPPPSAYGCFPRVIGHYSLELGLFPLDEAIRKMTGLPVSRYRIEKRGELMKGYFADIVIFNKDTIDEKFMPGEILTFAGAIDSVFLNGNLILHHGEFDNKARSGRVLRPAIYLKHSYPVFLS